MIRDARLSCRKPNQSGSGYCVTCIEEVYLPVCINTSLLPRLQNTNSVALRQTELALSRVSQLVANGAAWRRVRWNHTNLRVTLVCVCGSSFSGANGKDERRLYLSAIRFNHVCSSFVRTLFNLLEQNYYCGVNSGFARFELCQKDDFNIFRDFFFLLHFDQLKIIISNRVFNLQMCTRRTHLETTSST